jgi:hypothetical protein
MKVPVLAGTVMAVTVSLINLFNSLYLKTVKLVSGEK